MGDDDTDANEEDEVEAPTDIDTKIADDGEDKGGECRH
jgi:hypothetical protein